MKDVIAIFDPTLKLDKLDIRDVEYGTGDYKPTGNERRYSRMVGDLWPLVDINGLRFVGEEIEHMELDFTEFLPRLFLTVREKGGLVASTAFPKDGDVVSIYLASRAPDYKPIRQDYEVLTVIAPVSRDRAGERNTFSIDAQLRVPGLHRDRVKAFANQSSLETLQAIAKDLGLGFATNETGTRDRMTRICPSIPYIDFILQDVVPGAYKDEDSFYWVFIDQHYYLNFVEVNQMVRHSGQLDLVRINRVLRSVDLPDDPGDDDSEMTDLFLSNSSPSANTPLQITGYTPFHESGRLTTGNGHRTYLQQYDKKERKKTQYFMESLNSPDTGDRVVLKGREGDDPHEEVRSIWMGVQSVANVHPDYQHARLQNAYNGAEMGKLGLIVDLGGFCPPLYRSQSVPVYIVNSELKNPARHLATDTGEDERFVVDRFLSGFYVIAGLRHFFTRGRFYTQAILARREYDAPL